MKSKEELAAEQAAYWNGPGGKMWLGAYDRIQRGIAGFGEVALGRRQRPARRARARCRLRHRRHDGRARQGGRRRRGHVLGVDISEPLIEAARAQRLANATFEVGDATTHPFEAASFDLVFSRFGVMFFGDPVAAFKNIRRAMKPAGRLVFICWRTPQENPWAAVPMRAAQPFLPPIAAAGAGGSRPVFLRRSRPGRAHPDRGRLRRPVDRAGRPDAEPGQGRPRRAGDHRRLRAAGAGLQGRRARADRQGEGRRSPRR